MCVDWWASRPVPSPEAKLTTISTWKNLGNDTEWQGERYRWRKDIEFRRFMSLPLRSRVPLELALEGISPEGADELRQHGWHVVSARDLVDPAQYRRYIRSSLGEFTVAKDQYTRLHTGWFSDRSACYLAAGRPVITQETGFTDFYGGSEGLLSFRNMDDIVAAAESIRADYPRHARAAAEIAREYFEAEKVLASLLERAGV